MLKAVIGVIVAVGRGIEAVAVGRLLSGGDCEGSTIVGFIACAVDGTVGLPEITPFCVLPPPKSHALSRTAPAIKMAAIDFRRRGKRGTQVPLSPCSQ